MRIIYFIAIGFFIHSCSPKTHPESSNHVISISGDLEDSHDTINPPGVVPAYAFINAEKSSVGLKLYGYKIRSYRPEVNYEGVHIAGVTKSKDPNYLFLELEISPNTMPGTLKILLYGGDAVKAYDFELKIAD